MILDLSFPGMEHSGKARQIGADEAGVFSQFFNSTGRSSKHGAIGRFLMVFSRRAEVVQAR